MYLHGSYMYVLIGTVGFCWRRNKPNFPYFGWCDQIFIYKVNRLWLRCKQVAVCERIFQGSFIRRFGFLVSWSFLAFLELFFADACVMSITLAPPDITLITLSYGGGEASVIMASWMFSSLLLKKFLAYCGFIVVSARFLRSARDYSIKIINED